MDWLGRLNEALQYLEDNLESGPDIGRAAQIAQCSSFHFQRLFSYMAGVPLAEYLRRRRMTKAAFDLQNSPEKIIDIALRYGYDSPTAFNRAFRGVHGVAPSAARREGVVLKAHQPISFQISIRGDVEMNYRIEKKPAFRIVGCKLAVPNSQNGAEGFARIPKFWQETAAQGKIPQMCQLMNTEPLGVLGVSVGDWQSSATFDYYIAVSSTAPAPAGMAECEVPACTWAVFECRGAMPDAMQNMQRRIMTEWFPNSGYQYADAPDIEVYTEGDQSAPDYLSWIWVPVKK